jgi:hypothetical protein
VVNVAPASLPPPISVAPAIRRAHRIQHALPLLNPLVATSTPPPSLFKDSRKPDRHSRLAALYPLRRFLPKTWAILVPLNNPTVGGPQRPRQVLSPVPTDAPGHSSPNAKTKSRCERNFMKTCHRKRNTKGTHKRSKGCIAKSNVDEKRTAKQEPPAATPVFEPTPALTTTSPQPKAGPSPLVDAPEQPRTRPHRTPSVSASTPVRIFVGKSDIRTNVSVRTAALTLFTGGKFYMAERDYISDRVELRVEHGRSDPHAPKSRTLLEGMYIWMARCLSTDTIASSLINVYLLSRETFQQLTTCTTISHERHTSFRSPDQSSFVVLHSIIMFGVHPSPMSFCFTPSHDESVFDNRKNVFIHGSLHLVWFDNTTEHDSRCIA